MRCGLAVLLALASAAREAWAVPLVTVSVHTCDSSVLNMRAIIRSIANQGYENTEIILVDFFRPATVAAALREALPTLPVQVAEGTSLDTLRRDLDSDSAPYGYGLRAIVVELRPSVLRSERHSALAMAAAGKPRSGDSALTPHAPNHLQTRHAALSRAHLAPSVA